jgi:protein-disulfide isomerase
MAKPKLKQRKHKPGRDRAGISTGTYVAGLLLLAVCVLTALMLALEHISGQRLPGCGEGSACAEAAASVWATIPYVNWPVSFLGLAYFLGLFVVWLTARRGVPPGVRQIVRCGVLVSLGFLVVMIIEGLVCSYCVATHIGNIAFWILVERSDRASAGTARAFATIAAVFVISSATLGATEWRQRQAVETAAEQDLEQSTAAIIAATSELAAAGSDVAEPVAPAVDPAVTTGGGAAETGPPGGPTTERAATEVTSAPGTGDGGFTGRYRLGPEKAAIRVVMFTDYQCRECRRIEADVMAVFEQRDDMSVSCKHYPMNSECNRKVTRTRHPNACWAARAAETAGILRGDEGFWKMHFWLFEHGGSFTRGELRATLREFNYDVAEFERIMQGAQTLERVQADVEEAIGFGIWQTPSIFINGVELRGWNAPRAVFRAIERLAATHPEPMTAARDQPPPALEKLIGDWQAQPRRPLPAAPDFRTLGPTRPAGGDVRATPIRVVVFGDFRQSGTAEVDALLRRELAERGDVRYEYRYFPFNRDCNPAVQKETRFPQACRAAQAAEASGRLAGNQAYWKMHVWLLENQETLNDATLRDAASRIGIDPDLLLPEMDKPDLHAAVVDDAKLGQRLAVSAVPTVFVGDRLVPRWVLDGENILPRIIAEAAKE